MTRSRRRLRPSTALSFQYLERRVLLDCGGLSGYGDATGDGQVDLNDHAVMRVQFGLVTEESFPVATSDFNDDCKVDLSDYNILKNNFWTHPGGVVAPTGQESEELVLEFNAGE